MFNWGQLVISALVGAVIGYITNWIAIKMLFRPLTAKYILGIRVPLTPGVIPKEKARLAQSVGEAVSGHLLTGEYISGQLLSPRAEKQIRAFIREKIRDAGDKTLEDILEDLGIDSPTRGKWLEQVKCRTLKGIRGEQFRGLLAEVLAAGVINLLERKPGELFATEEFARDKRSLQKALARLLDESNCRQRIKEFLAERAGQLCTSTLTVKECIPGPLLDGLREYAEKQGPRIVILVENYLNSPETKELLAKRVEGFFSRSQVRRLLGNVLGLFGGDPGQIADKIVEEVTNFFTGPENREQLVKKMKQLLDDLQDRRICDLVLAVDAEIRGKIIVKLGDWLSDRICSGEILPGLAARAEKALADTGMTWGQLLGISNREEVEEYFEKVIEKITSNPDFEIMVQNFIDKLASSFLMTSVADLWPVFASGETVQLEEKVLGFYRNFVDRFLPGILDFVDFSQLVRRRVQELDVLQVEDLVLGIMRRELVAITWLGALLGAGIGISMAVLQVIL